MKKIVNMFLLIIGIFVFSLPIAHAYTFTRLLTVGMEGQDVLELQKILNSNPQTQIIGDTAGSPGNETTYFGEKTLQAVKKFQNLYKQDILSPAGLTEGTGFVGSKTISFLNEEKYINYQEKVKVQPEVITYEQIEQEIIGGANLELVPNTNGAVALFYPDTFATHAGREEEVNNETEIVDNHFRVGSGFKIKNLAFFLGKIKLKRGDCRSEYVCIFYIPNQTKPGTYTLKTSDEKYGSHEFKIVSMNVPYPEIKTEVIKLGKETVIKGDHLTDGMKVHTPFGVFNTDSSNNSFILEITDEMSHVTKSLEGGFYVENKQGLRSKLKSVTYEK